MTVPRWTLPTAKKDLAPPTIGERTVLSIVQAAAPGYDWLPGKGGDAAECSLSFGKGWYEVTLNVTDYGRVNVVITEDNCMETLTISTVQAFPHGEDPEGLSAFRVEQRIAKAIKDCVHIAIQRLHGVQKWLLQGQKGD